MGQLTSVGSISQEAWHTRFREMREAAPTYLVTVIEDTRLGKVGPVVRSRDLFAGLPEPPIFELSSSRRKFRLRLLLLLLPYPYP